jgi:hypothetical protein
MKLLAWKIEGKKSCEKLKRKWRDKIEVDHKETGYV